MKLRYIFNALAFGCVLLCGCSGEDASLTGKVISNDNKGKEKPTVEVEVKDQSDVEFTLTLTPSDDVNNYAYAVFAADSYEYAKIPSAYEIVTKSVSGAFSSASIIKADETTQDVNVKCILKEYYQVCVAAISKDGLLSEVDTMTVYIPGAHPDITFVDGVYTITPASAEDLADDAFDSPAVGQPFDVEFYVDPEDPTVYHANAYWFGAFGVDMVGSYDYSNNTIVFDGTEYGYESDGSAFGLIMGYADAAKSTIWVFYGGGSTGKDPVVFGCTVEDKKSKVTSIKSGGMEIDIRQFASGYPWLGVFGYFDEENTIVYKGPIEE